MKYIKISALLTAAVMLLQIPVLADGMTASGGNTEEVVTEYNYDGLMDPLTPSVLPVSGAELDVQAKSAVLIEQSTGKILYNKSENDTMPPASITKIMSILLIMEALSSNKITIDDTVTASEHASGMGGSQIWLEPGETMTVHELLKATIIGSANDATTALAEHVAGSEEGFVKLMNEKAALLGMKNTNFVNCTGLDAEKQYTSAYDVALMSRALLKHEKVKEYSTVWMDSLRGGQTQLVNTNKLVRFYEGCTGLKTGTTSQAGHCLSASASKGELSVIAVVMGSPTGNDRFNSARKLLDHAFANWAMTEVKIEDNQIPDVKVLGGVQNKVEISDFDNPKVLVPKGKEKEVKSQITVAEDAQAPVSDAQVLGKIEIKLGEELIAEIPLTAAIAVDEMTYGRALLKMLKTLFAL